MAWKRLAALCLSLWLAGCARRAERHPGEREPNHTIVVDGYVNHEAVHALIARLGRQATREELLAVHRAWIDEEVLYREGMALFPDASSPPPRERVVARMRAALDERAAPAPPSDAELERWFEAHRPRYERPALLDVEDATPPGRVTEAAARAQIASLARGAALDVRALGARPESSLAQSYGAEALAALTRAERGSWVALPTRAGWRALRLVTFTPAVTPDFAAQRALVRSDWEREVMGGRREAAVRALLDRYEIVLQEAHVCEADR
jgi:PPIC-type PPIASE domain